MYPLGGGAGGGAKIGGEQVSDNSMCTSRRWRSGGVAHCFVEGMVLLAAAVGWRMSSWFGLVYNIICLILPPLCLTELLPPFIYVIR